MNLTANCYLEFYKERTFMENEASSVYILIIQEIIVAIISTSLFKVGYQ